MKRRNKDSWTKEMNEHIQVVERSAEAGCFSLDLLIFLKCMSGIMLDIDH